MTDKQQNVSQAQIGVAIRRNRLNAGLTQVQLAKVIARSGKYLSEVETGKARITRRDLERLADAMGITADKILQEQGSLSDAEDWGLPRRIRDVQPVGLTIQTLTQLFNHLDRSGWLRRAKLWCISNEEFPEENDLALVEHLASLVDSKDVSLRYVYPANRLAPLVREQLGDVQGSTDALPDELIRALGWSNTLKPHLQQASDRVVGFAVTRPLPSLAQAHTLLWIETDDVSWSDVMPLLYCRAETRTFENPAEASTFWYHLPKTQGWNLLLELKELLKPSREGTANRTTL